MSGLIAHLPAVSCRYAYRKQERSALVVVCIGHHTLNYVEPKPTVFAIVSVAADEG